MHKIIPRYECKYCMCVKKTKIAFENHVYLCKYIHTTPSTNEINNSATPSVPILINYIVDLTKKYELLEAKVNQMQSTNYRKNSRIISDYLKLQTPDIPFQKWLEKCEINVSHLKIVFEKNAVEAMQTCISQRLNTDSVLQKIPFRAFKDKRKALYIYDRPTVDSQIFEWRIASREDVRKIINVLGGRILRMYLEWHKEQSIKEQSEEQYANYIRKVNDSTMEIDKKINRIKKTIIESIII